MRRWTLAVAVRSAAVLFSATMLLSACGEEPGWEPSAVETYLEKSQAASFGEGIDVGEADCPGKHALRDRMSLNCSLAVADAKVPYQVRLQHARGDDVAIDVRLGAVVLIGGDIEDYVHSTLPKGFAHATVDCGHQVLVAAIGDVISCTLASGAEEKALSVTVQDEAGRVAIS